jgi:hypothetical protein
VGNPLTPKICELHKEKKNKGKSGAKSAQPDENTEANIKGNQQLTGMACHDGE